MKQSPHESFGTASQYTKHLEVPIEAVLKIQQSLMHRMVPDRLRPYVVVSDGQHVGIEDDLFMRWHEKYSKLFREYCDGLDVTADAEQARSERIMESAPTIDDYTDMQLYLEDPARENKEEGIGGAFFTPEELDEFIGQHVH